MKIFYGINNKYIDITDFCFNTLRIHDLIVIPNNDNYRAFIFGDPLVGVKKNIYIVNDNNLFELDQKYIIKIYLSKNYFNIVDEEITYNKIQEIHKTLKINYGSLIDEFPEQLMATRYLTGNEKVLEIGGNIGRNSLVIGRLLNDSKNLLVIESDEKIYEQLTENRNINYMNFSIENSAISKRRLVQKGWDTIVIDENEEVPAGYKLINTITFDGLKQKYPEFYGEKPIDTMVIDCEGAFYYILMDFPKILDNIKLVIMENDYKEKFMKDYVDMILKENGFKLDYYQAGGWGPSQKNFFEVWKKD